MIKFDRYLILENSEDFASKWDERWHSWDYSYIEKKPTSYPCAFVWEENHNPGFLGRWSPISTQEASAVIAKMILEKMEELQNTLDTLDKLWYNLLTPTEERK